MLADVNDDSHQYRVPSTPNFSDVCSECITKHPVNITKREDRMLVVFLASITFFVQVSQIIIIIYSYATTYVQRPSSNNVFNNPFYHVLRNYCI